MKKIHVSLLSITCATLMAIFLYVPNVIAASEEVRLYTTPGSHSGTVGSSVSVQIRLKKTTNSKVDYAKADMRFNTSVLEVTAVSRSGSYFSSNSGPTTSFNNSSGTLVTSGSGDTMPYTADVLLASVTFRIKAAGSGSVSFTGSSQAGDLLGGGNVKNALTGSSGSTLTGVVATSSTSPRPSSTSPSSSQPSPSPSTPTESSTPAVTDTSKPSSDEAKVSPSTESRLVDTSTSPETDARFPPWEWVAGVALGALALIGGGSILVFKKLKGKPTEPVDETAAMDDIDRVNTEPTPNVSALEQFSAFPAENESSNQLDQPEVTETIEVDEPSPIETTAEPITEPVVTTQVAGIEIEPLDPAMPSPLMGTANETIIQEQPQPLPQSDITQAPIAAVTYPEPIPNEPLQRVSPEVIPDASVATGEDDFPDMFEEGEARLRAEGLDQQLGGSKTS